MQELGIHQRDKIPTWGLRRSLSRKCTRANSLLDVRAVDFLENILLRSEVERDKNIHLKGKIKEDYRDAS